MGLGCLQSQGQFLSVQERVMAALLQENPGCCFPDPPGIWTEAPRGAGVAEELWRLAGSSSSQR